jgi:acyl-CoA thioester hydrolase
LISHATRFRVRYAETDQMGVVYYANYLIWMEVGRAEYCRAIGAPYRELEQESGIRLAVVEAHCRYLAPARYDEEIDVATTISAANRRMMAFSYDIREAGGNRPLATGETKHIFLGPDMRPSRLPEKYYAFFGIVKPVTA